MQQFPQEQQQKSQSDKSGTPDEDLLGLPLLEKEESFDFLLSEDGEDEGADALELIRQFSQPEAALTNEEIWTLYQQEQGQ